MEIGQLRVRAQEKDVRSNKKVTFADFLDFSVENDALRRGVGCRIQDGVLSKKKPGEHRPASARYQLGWVSLFI